MSDGPDIVRAPSGQSRVALTFHGAGDLSLTRSVLAILAERQATVTVFAVGQWLAATPQVGRDILAAGHDLGNHTWSHQVMPRLSASAAAAEVSRGAAAVAASVGSAGLLFRPSGTSTSTPLIRAAAAAAGYHRCISDEVDPQDYADPGRDVVISRTLAGAWDGSIVSLHLGHQGTVEALPAILSALAGRGLRPVRLSTLLAGGS